MQMMTIHDLRREFIKLEPDNFEEVFKFLRSMGEYDIQWGYITSGSYHYVDTINGGWMIYLNSPTITFSELKSKYGHLVDREKYWW